MLLKFIETTKEWMMNLMAKMKKPRRVRCVNCSYMFESTSENTYIIDDKEITICHNCGAEIDKFGKLIWLNK